MSHQYDFKIKNIYLIISNNEIFLIIFQKKTQKYLVNKKRPITFATAFKQVLQSCEKSQKKSKINLVD